MNPNVSNPLKRYSLVSFFILAYGIAWIPMGFGLATGKYFLQGLSFFAPAISALILTGAIEGLSGIRTLISRLFLWRANCKWYLIALLAPIVLELLAILTHTLVGDTKSSLHFTDWIRMLPAQLPGLAILFLFLVVTSSGEELGWRGFALPGLQLRYGSVWASLILGLLWGLWHLPTFWIPGSPQYGVPVPGYILATVGYTFVYTCIFNGTKGSVLLACLYHGASNLTLTYGNAIFPGIISNLYLSLPALAIVVIVVIVLSGPRGLAGKQSLPDKDTA
jgi:membrane protease YdiL (CAAX protease family)